ncbi:MAG TPA: cyclic nucleotide-binding domain-containing protein [Thermoanaerobaculia bacterium]|nr:cyclic nucleotide-binding domain-containing protein [Thermoanaerobaculia bacterium]
MSDAKETSATLLARKEYARAIPLLQADLAKYPNNPRIRLQLADALAGAGEVAQAVEQYEQTARHYEENELIVQAIAVRKKAEKLRGAAAPAAAPAIPRIAIPKSPLFEVLSPEEREAVIREMVFVEHEEGDIIITEGEEGSSLYVLVSGEVKVFTRGPRGESIPLAALGEGDFFGEVSVLSGKPRTATITASKHSELLRLDRERLDEIIARHPRVRTVLEEFYQRRASHTVEAMIERMKHRGK